MAAVASVSTYLPPNYLRILASDTALSLSPPAIIQILIVVCLMMSGCSALR
jgi:hypothetical protein